MPALAKKGGKTRTACAKASLATASSSPCSVGDLCSNSDVLLKTVHHPDESLQPLGGVVSTNGGVFFRAVKNRRRN